MIGFSLMLLQAESPFFLTLEVAILLAFVAVVTKGMELNRAFVFAKPTAVGHIIAALLPSLT